MTARMFNSSLMLLWLPVFMGGLFCLKKHLQSGESMICGSAFQIFIGSAAGLCFLLVCRLPQWGAVWLQAGISNLVLAIFNMGLLKGLDGLAVFSEFFEKEEFLEAAAKTVIDKRSRRRLNERGISGYAQNCACCMVLGFQLMFPVVIAVNLFGLFL